jgi:uridine phosphorylase
MSAKAFDPSELILNDDGSIYHLALREEHIADTVIIVGDQSRVQKVSKYFDRIEFQIQNREFKTHTGEYRGKRMSVISTGIGTDNIDIFMNEVDAAVNINLEKRVFKPERKSLDIIRVGTSGALHADIDVGGHIVAQYALGFDGLIHFYDYAFSSEEVDIANRVRDHLNWNSVLPAPYIVKGSTSLAATIGSDMIPGITATAPGFYAPQGRSLYLKARLKSINEKLQAFNLNGLRINNFEMETSALYGFGSLMGHRCCTCCVVLANRATGAYSENHGKIVDELIEAVLEKIVDN